MILTIYFKFCLRNIVFYILLKECLKYYFKNIKLLDENKLNKNITKNKI